jgi:hypothetical protein
MNFWLIKKSILPLLVRIGLTLANMAGVMRAGVGLAVGRKVFRVLSKVPYYRKDRK